MQTRTTEEFPGERARKKSRPTYFLIRRSGVQVPAGAFSDKGGQWASSGGRRPRSRTLAWRRSIVLLRAADPLHRSRRVRGCPCLLRGRQRDRPGNLLPVLRLRQRLSMRAMALLRRLAARKPPGSPWRASHGPTRPAERIQRKEQVSALGGDARFAAAYEQLEGMRPGNLHAELLAQPCSTGAGFWTSSGSD